MKHKKQHSNLLEHIFIDPGAETVLGNQFQAVGKVLTCDPGFAVDGKPMVWKNSVVCLWEG